MICSTRFTPSPDDPEANSIIWPLIREAGSKCLAVLGTVKNAGKTEVLTRIIREADDSGVRLGLTSIGRDGEDKDAVFGNEKPPIVVPRGGLALTYLKFAGDALNNFQVLELMRENHMQFGDLAIIEAKEETKLQLAGPSKKSEVAEGVIRLKERGAELVLVDGAMDRKGAIDPEAVPDLILATGMALSPYVEEVAAQTAYTVELLVLPSWTGYIPEQTSYLFAGEWIPLDNQLVLGAEDEFVSSLPAAAEAVYLSGALTDRLVRSLKRQKKLVPLIVDCPFSVFVSRGLFRSYVARSGPIFVRQRINLLAVSVNPWGLTRTVDPMVLAQAVKKEIPNVRVVDVVAGIIL